jgi:hypothetical protein
MDKSLHYARKAAPWAIGSLFIYYVKVEALTRLIAEFR